MAVPTAQHRHYKIVTPRESTAISLRPHLPLAHDRLGRSMQTVAPY